MLVHMSSTNLTINILLEEALKKKQPLESEPGEESETWLNLIGGRNQSVRLEAAFRLQLVEEET